RTSLQIRSPGPPSRPSWPSPSTAAASTTSSTSGSSSPSWIFWLFSGKCDQILRLLHLFQLSFGLNIQDPLFRFFEREVKMGGKMLQEVRQDLSDVVQVCEGKKKQTNDLRTLISDLVKGVLPRSWCRYTVPSSMTVIQWVLDFSERIKQLQQISQAAASGGAKELKVQFVFRLKANQAVVVKVAAYGSALLLHPAQSTR
uniref:Dynein heavy chain C-terminal domain-containing protein n=1 Tax=Cyprinodon variegatus TaxID=28743 RepID=A0A3Q2CCL3_CYPVA